MDDEMVAMQRLARQVYPAIVYRCQTVTSDGVGCSVHLIMNGEHLLSAPNVHLLTLKIRHSNLAYMLD